MTLTATVGGATAPILLNTLDVTRRLDQRATCTFTVLDSTNALILQQNQAISISDSALGNLFFGIVDKVEDTHSEGVNATLVKVTTGKDLRYFADKRLVTDGERYNMMSGDIMCDLHTNYLAAEGVLATYCMRRDNTGALLGQGVLAGTGVVGDTLQLANAGTPITKTEKLTADFAAGTLTNVVAENNSLVLRHFEALKMVGTASPNMGPNLFVYTRIKTGLSITIAATDILAYDIYISSSSPAISGGVDLSFSDGTFLKDTGTRDQLGYLSHPYTDIGSYAKDQWYHREFVLTEESGRVLNYAQLGLEGEAAGTYTFYVANVVLMNSSRSIRTTIYSSGPPSKNSTWAITGYYNVKVTNTITYWHVGTRLTPLYSLTNLGILRDSVISWSAITTVLQSSSSTIVPILVEASYDGATWQACTNNTIIPNMLAGMNCAGKNLQVRYTLSLEGPNPEVTPTLTASTFTIRSSYACTKTDYSDSDYDTTTFNAGTLSNVEYNGGLRLKGDYRNWDDGSMVSQTNYTSSVRCDFYIENGRQLIYAQDTGGNDSKIRFDFAGNTWKDFQAEYDVIYTGPGNFNVGLIYRTTGWSNTMNSHAYAIEFSTDTVALTRSSNGGSSSSTLVQRSGTMVFTAGQYYHFRVVVQGSSHIVYINDLQAISVTDTTYSSAGYVGMRYYLNTGGGLQHGTSFDNFGISALAPITGNRIHPSQALSGVAENSIIQWNEIQTPNTTILVEASTDGSTWKACTNGGVIPGCEPGVTVTGKTLRIRETFTSNISSETPYITGISYTVVGNFSSSGTRVSPALSIDSVGIIGDTSVTWDAVNLPGASIVTDTSLDNLAWSRVANNGDPIAGLGMTSDPVIDDFTTGTGANYSSTFASGGAVGAYTYDTANSRLQMTGGNKSLYIWNSATGANSAIEGVLARSEKGGMVLRYAAVTTFYYTIVNDASSVSNPNTLQLFKIVAGTITQIGSTQTINFPRDTYHTLKMTATGTTLTVIFDGVQLLSQMDASIATGKGGLWGVMQTVQSLRFQVMGDSSVGKNVYTRVTMTTTDPLIGPILYSVTTSIKNRNIENGILVDTTDYQFKKSVGVACDDLAKAGNTYWYIDENKQFYSQSRYGTPAPWPLYSPVAGQPGNIRNTPLPKLVHSSPLYRNKQYITGAMDTIHYPEYWQGDGVRQSLALSFPVDTIISITVNGRNADVGPSSDNTGKEFYYTIGSNILQHDQGITPIADTDSVYIDYNGQIPYVAIAQNTAQQGILAALEGSTGIVEAFENIPNITRATADMLAQARITEYAILARQWSFATDMFGLRPAQLLYVFAPEYTLNDTPFLVSEVQMHIQQRIIAGVATIVASFDILAIEGPDIGSWSKLFVQPV